LFGCGVYKQRGAAPVAQLAGPRSRAIPAKPPRRPVAARPLAARA
jgi:hypothetical protein